MEASRHVKINDQAVEDAAVDQLLGWLKAKNLSHIAHFIIDSHRPVLGILSQVALSFSYLSPLFGLNSPVSRIILLLSNKESIEALSNKLKALD